MSFLWNHFLFSDFNKFVSTANKRNLNEGDIWGLGEKHRTFNIHEKMEASEILISGLYEVFHILFTLTNPIALKMLMDYIEKERGDYLRGYIVSFFPHGDWTALMSAIYKKSLRVPHFNGGNVISLVSVDCQWLVKAIRFIHLPWSCPLQIIIAIYLLYNILGVAIVPGIIIIFILIGISFLLSLLLQKFQKSHLKKKDIRLSRIMEALGHFKTIKLNCWEESIIDKIGILRSDEISVMKKFLSMQALQVFLWNCGIFIFSFSAFATFSFYSHQMSVQSIFVSAALVNTMRIPFRLLPSCISALSQGIVSIKRIDSYLNREEMAILFKYRTGWGINGSGWKASNGSTLSGGQRQRIGFARAIYQNAQVYLMDDPLSACDSNLKAQIFHNTIGPKGLIPLMDRIIVIQNGTVVYEGTYDQFKSHFSSVNEFLEPDETQNEKIEEEKDSAEEVKSFEIAKKNITFSIWELCLFIIALVGYLISQCFDVCSKLWLSRWTNLSSTNINDTNYRHIYNEDTRNMYIVVYGILGWCQSLAYFLSVLLINSRSLKASSHFHDVILRKVFGAPLNFFWSTPKGTIINRFSKDMGRSGHVLTKTLLKNFAYQAVKILGTLIIALIAFPITAFFIVCPLGLIFIEVVKSYLMASRFLKRTSATKLAMVLKHFGDSAVHGGTTIRCYGVESDYIDEHMSLIDEHQSVSLMEIISEAWKNSSSLSALSLTSSLTVLQDIFLFTRYAAFIEKAMVSIERIKECEDLIPQDPSSGLLPSIITNVGKYSSLKNASIKNFTLNVRLGEKVGVTCHQEQHGIFVKKDITVIPQDAALFKGSIRYNLDPDDRFTDEYIWSVLDEAQMKEFFVQLPVWVKKQLICCLRGLLTGSNLIIMDEATSAMTLESEERILNTYFSRFSSSTIFVIAHRIQPLLACDKILVLENGTIAEFGNPESLIKSQKSIFKSMLRRTNGSVE
ncbi:unnamed protein product [Lepeophtheirus salmonis]|uniref:(salmon louse) hypothetical protein n=1 Tax=Lepeophtheirus salmonis TaxID=72036 RepID=A0A7R8HCV1_LEPSM|nr:unnamed protein product [Lepeophtheirus salmonis]CAF3008998.1 unnamed protein product [Lepeophtheirus salmonis]